MPSHKSDLEYKMIPFELKNIIEEDPDNFQFVGYASTFGNIDRGDDIIEKGAFTESLKNITPSLLWQHTMSEPIGILPEIREDDIGLYVKGLMPKEDTFVKGRVMPQMRIGSTKTMSIGFRVLEEELKKVGDKVVRIIKKVMLWEVSIVTLPMNALATVTDMKAAIPFQDLPFPKDSSGEIDLTVPWDASEALKRVKTFTGSDEAPSSKYKNAFLWFDAQDSENFGAYKLPIADVVDGKLVAIPRGIFASAAALRGARGGVDIPDSQRDQVIKNVNRYYSKMDKPSPFEKSFIPYFENFESIKDVSSFLKDFGLSNGESNALVHSIKKQMTKSMSDENALSILKKGLDGL